MKWKKYLLNGVWHVHSNYTDGKNSISEYCDMVKKLRLKLICFTEHISLRPSYNFNNYLSDIKKARRKHCIKVLGGIEVKILDDDLNVDKDVLKNADVIFGAVHGKVGSHKEYMHKVKRLLTRDIDVWAHPTLPLKLNNLRIDEEDVKEIIKLLKNEGIVVEINVKYNVPDTYFISKCLKENIPLLIGLDAHSVEEVERYWR